MAPTILLVAPAGYGKTTLARQWHQRVDGAWLGISPASADIPVLAREVVAALSELAPLDPKPIEGAIRANKTALDQAHAVARAILSQLSVPKTAWLIIDDYHVLGENQAADVLISTLEKSNRLRLLISSRERPAWVTPRRLLYGEVLEIVAGELAFDDGEISSLLSPGRLPARLRQQIRGWPAVIGLAAYAKASDPSNDVGSLSTTLYVYFADELYERASVTVQRCLTAIAIFPPLDRVGLTDVCGESDVANRVLATGLAYETDGRVEVHPLARAFLCSKARTRSDVHDLVRQSVSFALEHDFWDEAFRVIVEFDAIDQLEDLIALSFSSLVETGRTTTLAAFARHASARGGVSKNLLDLVEADSALREGAFERARVLARSAALGLSEDHGLRARAYLVAGRAAHLGHRFEEAFDLFTQALETSVTPREAGEAAWGRVLATLFPESERLVEVIGDLEEVPSRGPEERLRVLIGRIHVARFRDGFRELETQDDEASRLLPLTDDPWVRTAWGNNYGHALTLQAEYARAGEVLRKTLGDVDQFEMSFCRPHIEWTLASAELGLRHFARAESLLRRVEQEADTGSSLHLHLNVQALRARLCLAQQRHDEAVALTLGEFRTIPTPSMYGEYLATRALALAVVGERRRAVASARRASAMTQTVDTKVLCAAAQALASLDRPQWKKAAEALLETAAQLRTWDGLVCAVRAAPRLLDQLVSIPQHRGELRLVLIRSNDTALAKATGLSTRTHGSRGILSAREREVIDLLRLGSRNDEIASTLFISVATVKVHVRHIMEKLGARTRAEAVARYADVTGGISPSD